MHHSDNDDIDYTNNLNKHLTHFNNEAIQHSPFNVIPLQYVHTYKYCLGHPLFFMRRYCLLYVVNLYLINDSGKEHPNITLHNHRHEQIAFRFQSILHSSGEGRGDSVLNIATIQKTKI